MLAPLREHAKNLYASGAPTVLHEVVQSALFDVTRTLRNLRDRLASDSRDAQEAIAQMEQGILPTSYVLSEQTNHSAIVIAETLETQRNSLSALLDVFAALGDRIKATPEERARAEEEAAERAKRATADLAARWGKKSTAALADAADANGIPRGKRAAMIGALAEKGISPDA